MNKIVNLISRDKAVRIEVVPGKEMFDIISIKKSDKGKVLGVTDNVYLIDVEFKTVGGKAVIVGKFRGRVPHKHAGVGVEVTYDHGQDMFINEETGEEVKKAGVITIFGNDIRLLI